MDLVIENRQIKPAVVNLFQFESGTTTLNFKLDSYIHDDTVDLRNYKAYAVTSVNGHIDMTELESTYDESTDTLTVSWTVQEYSLREEGHVSFQIVFKENANDGENTGVYHTYKAIIVCRESIEVDERIVSDYPTLLKQWLDRINQLAGGADKGFFYIPYGETIPPSERLDGTLYWQWDNADNTDGHFEDNDGNVLEFTQYKENTKYLPNQDLLGDMTNGKSADQHYFTAGSAIKNAPITNSYCLVKQYDSGETNRFIQEVQVPDSNNVVRTFVRCVTGDKEHGIDKVGAWQELATSNDLTAVVHKASNETITGVKTFSASPKVPTAGASSNDTTAASTAFVTSAITTEANRAKNAESLLAPKASPALTGTPTAPTAASGTNTTQIATTAFVKTAIANGNAGTATKLANARTITLSGDATGSVSFDGSENKTLNVTVNDDSHNHVISNVDGLQNALNEKATDTAVVHKASNETITGVKTFSASPKVPTAGASSNDTTAASTAFVKTAIAVAMPVGSVIPFAGNTTPSGYLFCDGSAVSRTTYANLFAVIGTTYGAGNGSTTFNLPNLVDKFIQGNATAGTVKAAGLPNITGSIGGNEKSTRIPCDGAFRHSGDDITSGKYDMDGTVVNGYGVTFDASRSNSIYGNSNTVQPPALTMRYCIKY